jgi:hypothetical protein
VKMLDWRSILSDNAAGTISPHGLQVILAQLLRTWQSVEVCHDEVEDEE